MRGRRIRKPTEIFLSHARADRKFVNRLVKVLRDNGIRYWYSKTHLRGAQRWHDEIGRALNRCDWFAVVMSPAATKSEWVKRELLYVLDAGRYGRKIVPLLHKPCSHARLSWTLGAFQFVDFTLDFEDGCRDLLRIWGQTYRRRASRNHNTNTKKTK